MNIEDLNYIENEAANLSNLDVKNISAGIVNDTFIGIKYNNKFIGHAWYNKGDWTILNVYVATHKLNKIIS